MMMLVPSTATPAVMHTSVVLSNGVHPVASALCRRLGSVGGVGGHSEVRSSSALDSWDGLTKACEGADTVYLLSALDLPLAHSSSDAALQDFRSGVSRVLKCCQDCGVQSLVFTSSSDVVSSTEGIDDTAREQRVPYVAEKQGATVHAVAMAEAEIIEASGTQTAGGSLRLHTCALRPATIYGTEEDRSIQRALSWVGWGLNRLAVGAKGAKAGSMVFAENLVEAQVLAGANLMGGITPDAPSGEVEQRPRAPSASGRSYVITDGQPCNLQAFMDGILSGLDFPTSKVLRVPIEVALFTARVAELAYQIGITKRPAWTRAGVRRLIEGHTFSIARAREDLGYEPIVDPETALQRTVDSLKRAGWGRHHLRMPSLGYCICNPLGIWLVTLAAFGGPCPAFLAPLASNSAHVGLLLVHQLSRVRAVCVSVYLIHVLEGVYAYRAANKAGHRDTAPLWFLQTFVIGFPSIALVNKLKSESV